MTEHLKIKMSHFKIHKILSLLLLYYLIILYDDYLIRTLYFYKHIK